MRNFLTRNKATLILCVVFFSFIIFSNVNASTFNTQTVTSTIAYVSQPYGTYNANGYGLTQSFKLGGANATSSVSSIGVWVNISSGVTIDVRFRGPYNTKDLADADAGSGNANYICHTYPNWDGPISGYYVRNIYESPCIVYNDKWYNVTFTSSDNGSSGKTGALYGNTSDIYLNGTLTNWNGGNKNGVADIYMDIISNQSFPPDTSSVSIVTPANATTTADFGSWIANYNKITTSTNAFLEILYSTTSSTISTATSTNVTGAFLDVKALPNAVSSSTSATVAKPEYLNTTTYYARAFLTDGDYQTINGQLYFIKTILASSTMSSFTISSATTSFGSQWVAPTSTATSSNWVITCDSTSGFFGNSLCLLGAYLFSPKYSDLDQFKTLYTDLQNKPPFGYFNSIKNTLANVGASASSTYAFSDFSYLSGTFLGTLRTQVGWLLYVFFGFWIFHRFRHLNL